MAARTDLHHYIETLLDAPNVDDYCANGLQVQGKADIKRLVTGVTASQAFIDKAIALKADAVLVHHGYFWRGEDPCLVGIKHKRIKTVLAHDINLFSYHIPLDVHETFGNNAQLAALCGWDIHGTLPTPTKPDIVMHGALPTAMAADALAADIAQHLDRPPLLIKGHDRPVKNIAWCTGGAQDYLRCVIDHHVDAYITGEISERHVHIARECGINYYACGHHATERYGAKALGEHLAEKFDLDVTFLDIANPV